MTGEEKRFLEALGAALKNRKVTWGGEVTREELVAVFDLAERHRVLPLIYQTVHACDAARAAGDLMPRYRAATMHSVMLQTQKTAEFLPVLAELREAGVQPLVVKGIICRRLYPYPDQRFSSDEDVWILPENFPVGHEILERCGMTTKDPDSTDYELPYFSRSGAMYLEIHRSLFSPESPVFGSMNRFFDEASGRAIVVEGVPTLCHTDHLLYLICHAFKHFVHSGFGLRQVCDLILFANAYGREVDWLYILDCCRRFRGERFAAALFAIGEAYLGFEAEQAGYPEQWRSISVEIMPMLRDLLCAGVYGSADMSRQHSSTITLNAVADQTRGKRPGGLLRTVFPSAKALSGSYPYLKDTPMLLPIAWAQRLVKYGKESGTPDNRATESIRLGRERLELLRQYGILDKL